MKKRWQQLPTYIIMTYFHNCTTLEHDCKNGFSSSVLNNESIFCNGQYDCYNRNDENPYLCHYNSTRTEDADEGYNRYLGENYVTHKAALFIINASLNECRFIIK